MSETRPPDPAPVPHGPLPPRRPSPPPGQRRARHQRWTRVTTWVTVVGLVLLVGGGTLLLVRAFDKPSLEESQVKGAGEFLVGLAQEVDFFAKARNRLPTRLAELRAPDLPSAYDAEPWDVWRKPIEYRIVDAEARTFQLRSLGPDLTPGTADDVVWPPGAVWP